MTVNPDRMASDGRGRPLPRKRWWQLGTSVGQTLLVMLGLTLLALPGMINGWTKLFIWLQIGFILLYVGVLVCGIATIVLLRRHPEMQQATAQQKPLDRTTRRRHAVATLGGFGLALLSFVAAVLLQTPIVWIAFVIIGVVTFFCLVQLGRPLIARDVTPQSADQPHAP